MKNTAEILRDHGLKVTPQRLAIYSMLKCTDSHPNAETIFKALEKDNPTMSLATVYKTLNSFKSTNLVKEINSGDGCSHYDAIVEPHNHFICKECNSIIDIFCNSIDSIEKSVSDDFDCDIDYTQLFFFGTCPKCKTKSKTN